MKRAVLAVGLLVMSMVSQVVLGEEPEEGPQTLNSREFPISASSLQRDVIPLEPGVPVQGSCRAHTDPQFVASLCSTEYTIDLPADTESLLVLMGKEGVKDLILAMSFGKSIHDRLRDEEGAWVSRPIDSSPSRDVERMGWKRDELLSEGRLPGTWYIGVINKESSPQDYTITALVVTQETNEPPDADFSFSPSRPTTDDTVQFTDRSSDPDGEVVDWEWDFGDGSTNTRQNPSHLYSRAGTYTVELTVTDDDGATDSVSKSITVEEPPNERPEADFSFSPTNPTTDDTVQFTDRSSDPDGRISRWQWDFGDGNTSTSQNPTHRYTRTGTFTVRLTVTDDEGATDSASKSITVRPGIPTAPSNLQANALSTTEIELRWRDNSDNEDGFIIERRRPGGSWGEIDRVGRNTTRYTNTGLRPDTEYCYRVTAYNDAGDSDPSNEACATTERELEAPQADFTFSPSSPTIEDTIQFTDRSRDPDGQIERWQWDFGDGSSSTQQNPTHRYTQPGSYTVSLTVTDDDGLSATAEKSITVSPRANRPPSADAGPDQTVRVGETVQLDGSRSRDPDGDPLSFHWRFRSRPSGSQATLSDPTSARTTFVADAAGQYLVELTVDDGRGGADSDTVTITAESPPPPPPEPVLEVTPTELGLSARVGEPDPTSSFTVKNEGGGMLEWTARTQTDAGWLRLQPTQGALGAGEAREVTVTALLAGLSAGTHRARITVEAPGIGMAIVEVVLELRPEEVPPEGPLRVEPTGLSFRAPMGGPNPESQTLTLTNTGDRPLTWGATVEVGWLFLDFTGGTLPAGGRVDLQAMVDITGLSAGTYEGTITFSAPRNPEVSPVTVPVTLTVEGPTPPPGEGDLLAIKFVKLEFLQPQDWQRELREGCVVYTNISAEPSPIRVMLPDGSTREFEIPSGREVIVCGDVVHIDTGLRG